MKSFISKFTTIDARLCKLIYKLSGKNFLDHLFYTISRLGDGWLYALLTTLYFIFRRRPALSILPALFAAFVIESISYTLIKKNVKRIRPFKKIEEITSLIIPPDEFSFPSGHTAGAVIFAIICGSVFPQLKALLYLFAAAMGFSRVYNGVHYPGDVFAGAALGIISAKIGLLVF